MPLRLAMLGVHHPHAHGMVRQIAAHADEFEILGIYDPEPDVMADRQRGWQAHLGATRTCRSLDALFALPLDGIIIEGRVHENLRWARLALEHGLPVMLEKPAGTDFREFCDVIELARERSLHLQMIYLFRYMSAVEKMLELARSGLLGDVYELRARMPKNLLLYAEHVDAYARYRGGIFFEMAGHVIDMMVAILGRPQRVTPFLAHHHRQPGGFIDNGIAVFEFDRATGLIEVNSLELAPDARRIEVYGTRGACAIPNLGSGHLANSATQAVDVFLEGQTTWHRFDLPSATLQIADLREFAACLRGEKPPDYSLAHDQVVQEALLRASAALDENE